MRGITGQLKPFYLSIQTEGPVSSFVIHLALSARRCKSLYSFQKTLRQCRQMKFF